MDKNQLNKIKNIVEAKNMKKMMFTMEGNLCAARIREGRYRHNPPLTQEDLARKVCDAELRLLAKALEVSMEWLVGDLPLFPL